MLRTITIHPLSLAVGAVFAAVILFSMSQSTTPMSQRIEYGPQPKDFVRVQEGQPWTVPAGKVFVPTALGTADQWSAGVSTTMSVNGAATCYYTNGGIGTQSVIALAGGIVIPAGSTIQVANTWNPALMGEVWGYTAPALGGPGTGITAIRVHFDVPARDIVSILSAAPFTVPLGKMLVLTASTDSGAITINGALVFTAGVSPVGPTTASGLTSIPEGLVAPAASLVACTNGCSAWGYLVTHR